MGQGQGKISVIVVNWNGEPLLQACLSALGRQSYSNREVIFVDNGSSDGSVRLVEENFPEINVVVLAQNKGFAGGNVAGLEVATGDFIALLNNDGRPEKNWLENLIQPMFHEPTIGICASKLLIDGAELINSAGGSVTSAGVGFDRGFGEPRGHYEKPELVFGACAAAVLYRRKMLQEIGFFDESFFLYGEDTDLSFRAQLAGWKCMYVPTAIVYHKFHSTAGLQSDTHVYHHNRNLEFVWIKNMPRSLMLRYAHHKMLQEFGHFRTYCLRLRKWGPFLRAKRDGLRMLPEMLRKRQEIQSKKQVSDDYIEQMLTPLFSEQMIRHRRYSRIVLCHPEGLQS